MTRWTFPMFAASLILSGEMKGYAEQTARQSFHVHVSPRMAIRCPTFALSPPPLPLELQSPVPQQDWEVSTNSRCGATIQIATEHCFHAVNDSRNRQDAHLELKILSQSLNGTWSVTQPIAVTNHEAGVEVIQVQACTFNPGSAVLGLTVRSLGGASKMIHGGAYEAQVVATITAH